MRLLIGLQLLALGLALVLRPERAARLIGVATILIGAAACLRRDGESVITRVVNRARGARPLTDATDGESPDQANPDDVTAAMFPGLRTSAARDRRGRAFALWHWSGTTTVALTLAEAELISVGSAAATWLPLDQVYRRLVTAELPVESLALLSVVGASAVPSPPTLVIRLRPDRRPTAIEIRGGGDVGTTAAAAAALGHAEAALREVGIRATPVTTTTAEEVLRMHLQVVRDVLPESPTSRDDQRVLVHGTQHRTFTARELPYDSDLTALWLAPTPLRVVCAELVPTSGSAAQSDELGLRCLVRVIEPSDRELPTAPTALAPGVRWSVDRDQRAAMRASSLLGDGLPLPEPLRLPPATSPLRSRMITATDRTAQLVPSTGIRAQIGLDDGDRPVMVNLLSRRARRVLAVGDGSPVITLFSQALAAGLPAVVLSPQPDVWRLAAAHVGASDRVALVADERELSAPTPPGPLLVVLDGAADPHSELGRGSWHVQLQHVQSITQLTRALPDGADALVLGHGIPPEEIAIVAESMRIDLELLAGVISRPDRALLISGGRVITIRTGPSGRAA